MRKIVAALALLSILVAGSKVLPQSPNGSIRGIVLDPDSKAIPGAEVIAVNDATRLQYEIKTNGEGIYAVENLPPGSYRLQVSKFGFKAIIKPDIILNVQDALVLNFSLEVGASSVVVTVEGGAPIVNTSDATVSTVIDRNFVANIPLNGRSFQDLILLTPGVVTASPQNSAIAGYSGEFSVNGQRNDANYYSVDGVSANIGVSIGGVQQAGASGALPVTTALGTTQGLVSVDALEEFRVQTSTYSAEYGRSPGAQISFQTRSGTNQWHGSAFDYFRNDALDANDWFSNYYGQPKSAERQNDFGGTIGGPVEVPGLYDGKDRTFFFFSYEGLRLEQPQPAVVSYVPTVALRESVPTVLQPVLNGFPLPNCPSGATNCTNDLGNGLGEFIGTWSNPSSLDSYGIRLDEALTEHEHLFFRFSSTSSNSGSRLAGEYESPSVFTQTSYQTRTYTAGLTSMFSNRVNNDLHFNYSSNSGSISETPTDFAGGEAVNLFSLTGLPQGANAFVEVGLFLQGALGQYPAIYQGNYVGLQKQWNIVDSLKMTAGRHQLAFGVDYRRMVPSAAKYNPYVEYEYLSQSALEANAGDVFAQNATPMYLCFQNLSSFVQDDWRATGRLSISLGLRWEINPAPSVTQGKKPYTIESNEGLAGMTLAPEGTPLWQTGWHNLAPRLGVAYILRDDPKFETVIRGGGGVFYDTGQQLGGVGYSGPGFASSQFLSSIGFPAPLGSIVPTIQNPPVPPYGTVYAFPSHLQLPYTWQTNVSVEQALGKSQDLTISYVGAFARKLLEERELLNLQGINPAFTSAVFFQNGGTSDYNSFQVQFQRRLSQGLQALASYTLSHCLDYGSQNSSFPYARGNCDFDVRNNFSSALSYDIPKKFNGFVAKALLDNWGIDGRWSARSAFPVTLLGSAYIDPATGQYQYLGLNLVPGRSVYLRGPQYPGGRAIDVAAFENPEPGAFGNAPRNFVRGFDAWQMDLAVHRDFPIGERWKLQFRIEAFNVFNHPNFGTINDYWSSGSPTFGLATATLANSLGILSPLYQMGGPRSLQLSLRLMF